MDESDMHDATLAESLLQAPEPPPPPDPIAAKRAALQGKYYHKGSHPTYHPVLKEIKPGLNDFSWAEEQYKDVLNDLVKTGTLRRA